MRLLPEELLMQTGDVDHANWNYQPFLGWIQRLRFSLASTLLEGVQSRRLLEVGYGSGIFMPELNQHCQELYGIDIHNKHTGIGDALVKVGVQAKLFSGTIECTKFEDNLFDVVIAVSVLEFVNDIDSACKEINRILRRDGFLIVVTPSHSKIVDIGLNILTSESAEKDYGNRRERLIPALRNNFLIEKQLVSPPILSSIIPLYSGLKLYTLME